MKKIHVTASQARKDLFQLIDKVANGAEIIISKSNTEPVVLKKETSKGNKKNKVDVEALFGSLQSSIPYNPQESQIAHRLYIQDQAKKYQTRKK